MRAAGDDYRPRLTIYFNRVPLEARAGDSVASALLAAGHVSLGRHVVSGRPRGIFCGMGVCAECVATVDGTAAVPTCLTPVRPGMQVEAPLE